MIVAIARASGTGIEPIEEVRFADDAPSALAAFAAEPDPPLDPADYIAVDTGWQKGGGEPDGYWAWDYDSGVLVADLAAHQDELADQVRRHRDVRFGTALFFEYPTSSGNFFSCQAEAQNEWVKLSEGKSRGLVARDFPVLTFDGRRSYMIRDEADLTNLLAANFAVVIPERAAADAAITNVMAASTAAAARVAASAYLDL